MQGSFFVKNIDNLMRIRFMASTTSSGKNNVLSLFGTPKRLHGASPLPLSVQILGFFWL